MTGRGLRGRQTAQRLLAIAVGLDALVVFFFLNQPHFIGPMRAEPPSVVEWLIPAAGVAANIFGMLWMIRIYRADPEAHPVAWRYHRR